MARTAVACLLLYIFLAATTMWAAAKASVTGSIFCDRDSNSIMTSPWPQTDRLYHGCLSRPDTPSTSSSVQLRCIYSNRPIEVYFAFTNTVNGFYRFDNDLPTIEDGIPGNYTCTVLLATFKDPTCGFPWPLRWRR
eukprot:SM002800S10813  [mRNA]  locus=s2800:658:1389:+ [translate_table: standard]